MDSCRVDVSAVNGDPKLFGAMCSMLASVGTVITHVVHIESRRISMEIAFRGTPVYQAMRQLNDAANWSSSNAR